MINYFGILILALAISVWTISVAPVFQIIAVNLAIVAGMIFILKSGYWYLFYAACVGLMLDYFSAAPFLFYTIIFLAALTAVHLVNTKFTHENMIRFFSLSLIAVILYRILEVAMTLIYSWFNLMQFNLGFFDVLNLSLVIEVLITFFLVVLYRFGSAINHSRKHQAVG